MTGERLIDQVNRIIAQAPPPIQVPQAFHDAEADVAAAPPRPASPPRQGGPSWSAFWQEIHTILDQTGDVCSEAAWQRFAAAIAAHATQIRGQNTMATFVMIKHCAETLLKMRALRQRGKDTQESTQAFERWLQEIGLEAQQLREPAFDDEDDTGDG